MKEHEGDSRMSELPKLKVKGLPWSEAEEIYDIERAKHFPFSSDYLVVVEGQVVHSYDELLQLASQPSYQNKEFLEMKFLPGIVGG